MTGDRPRAGRGGHRRVGRSRDRGPLLAGLALLGLFVRIETTGGPSRSCRCASWRAGTRTSANVPRPRVRRDVRHLLLPHPVPPGRPGLHAVAGRARLPARPASVFLSSQLASKVLINRVRPKTLMLGGIATVIVSLVLSSRLHTGASYREVLLSLVLLGVGSGTSLVTLTSASLAGVEPRRRRCRLGAGQRHPAGRCRPRAGRPRDRVRRRHRPDRSSVPAPRRRSGPHASPSPRSRRGLRGRGALRSGGAGHGGGLGDGCRLRPSSFIEAQAPNCGR